MLTVHIIFGVLALVTGSLSAISVKRAGWHTRFGQAYVASMFGVVLTAVAVLFSRTNVFLAFVALFSFQLTYFGWRSAKLKNRPPARFDFILANGARVWGTGFVGFGVYRVIQKDPMGWIAIIFGVTSFRQALNDLKQLRANNSRVPWRVHHLKLMGGAMIATSTAVLVTNAARWAPSLPPWLMWSLPTIVGSVLISRAAKKYSPRKKLA